MVMKFRIFYAPQTAGTWEKIFVLTSNGKLYCEYLMRFSSRTIEKDNIDYENFKASDYSWGKGVVGEKTLAGKAEGAVTNYQACKTELKYSEYISLSPSSLLKSYKTEDINRQIRWVTRYLDLLNISYGNWDEEVYKKHNN